MRTKTKNNFVSLFETLGLYQRALAATQNGVPLTCQTISGTADRAYHALCYVASPTSGVFTVGWSGTSTFQYSIFTLQNAAQTSPIDAAYLTSITSSSASISTN